MGLAFDYVELAIVIVIDYAATLQGDTSIATSGEYPYVATYLGRYSYVTPALFPSILRETFLLMSPTVA